MCKARFASIAALLVLPSWAAAQPTTADGIRAIAAGDAARAVRILEPLAEASTPDPLAQFFLGTLYGTGAGVPGDHIRACRLYLRSAAAAHALANQARVLADDFLARSFPIAKELCESARTAVRIAPSAAASDLTRDSRETRTPTDAGIEAFVRGDYATAVEVFRSLAERWPGPVDHTATFFMAVLYENGLGVHQDIIRACALYQRIDTGLRLYGRLVPEFLLPALERSMTESQIADCRLLSSIGFDHRFQPATFALEAGHWIDVELSGKVNGILGTVGYPGRNDGVELELSLRPGVIVLPIEHTALNVGGLTPGRRHFVEIATWTPDRAKGEWQLEWSLFEVVRGDVLSIAQWVLATVPGTDPPDDLRVDLRRLIALRVNRDGNAEWAVLTGPDTHSEVIETDIERQEIRAQREARKAADERMDWNQARSSDRKPAFSYTDAEGCSDLFAYGWSVDRMEAIAIQADRAALRLSTATTTFDVAAVARQVRVSVEVYERPQRHWPFCTDVGAKDPTNRKQIWHAVGGTISFQLTPGIRTRNPDFYRVRIQIDGAEFVNSAGVRVRLTKPVLITAIAGARFGKHGANATDILAVVIDVEPTILADAL